MDRLTPCKDEDDLQKQLVTACKKNQSKIVKLLIEKGADVNAIDNFGETAMHAAAEKGHLRCLKELLYAKAKTNIPTKVLNNFPTSISHVGGMTPLHFAALNNKINCVIELIQACADYNAVDEKGRTSLYIAAEFGFWDCVMAHLRTVISPPILSLPSFKEQITPLHFAVKNSAIECIQELVKLGSDPNHLNASGLSPLHYAVRNMVGDRNEQCETVLKLLVLKGYNVDINKQDFVGNTPLHYVTFDSSIFVRRPHLACFLIKHGANPLIKNALGTTLIEYEMRRGNYDLSILEAIKQSMVILPPLHTLHIPLHNQRRDRIFWRRQLMRNFKVGNNEDEQKKYQWYEESSCLFPSLKHYCKLEIRKSLGPQRIRYVNQLDLPIKFNRYLLLEPDSPMHTAEGCEEVMNFQ